MTLRELLDAHPSAFYPQDWHKGQRFLDVAHTVKLTVPDAVVHAEPDMAGYLPYAVTLAWAYLQSPESWVWTHYLWTADVDDFGHRVYVGGVGQNGIDTWQVHRELAYDSRLWGLAVWT